MMELSEKEIQVIELKSEGLTNREISRHILSNTKAVKTVLKGLYEKSGCKNAAHLTKWAIQNQFLKIKSQMVPPKPDKAA